MSVASGSQQIDISTIPVPQLSQLQQRLTQELEHLSTSYQRLRAAQARFKDCVRSIKEGVEGKSGETPLLIPLTTSLYIPGTLVASPSPSSTAFTAPSSTKLTPSVPATASEVLVDLGTGFFVSKTTSEAITFYNGKIEGLNKNLADIERIVQGKSENIRIVEDVLREKVLAQQANESGGAAASGTRPGASFQSGSDSKQKS